MRSRRTRCGSWHAVSPNDPPSHPPTLPTSPPSPPAHPPTLPPSLSPSQNKNSVIFFYGADSAPSCSKEIEAFDASLSEFRSAGVTVVGVRNEKGATLEGKNIKLVVDEDDELRKELGIKEDLFGLLGGRETYVVDKSGKVVEVHNNQFDPKSHVTKSLAAVEELKKSAPAPAFELPDIKQVAGVFGINLYGLK